MYVVLDALLSAPQVQCIYVCCLLLAPQVQYSCLLFVHFREPKSALPHQCPPIQPQPETLLFEPEEQEQGGNTDGVAIILPYP